MNLTGLELRAMIKAAADKPRPQRGVLHALRRHVHEDGVVERLARLQRFAAEQSSAPFVWGATDCCLLLADWLVANGLPDGAAALRGTYGSEDECRAVIAHAGGVLPLVTACAEMAGLQKAIEPQIGSVAVIGAVHRIDRQWGAIWNGRRWLTRWSDGFTSFAARPLAMWSVI